jgi:hypothetical protein
MSNHSIKIFSLPLFIFMASTTFAAEAVVLEERIDIFDHASGQYLGSEQTWYAPDGRRLRWVITDAQGATTLLFFLLHDDQGRESEAIYFEEGSEEPDREVFIYTDGGHLRTTVYYYEPGVAADRTEADLDDSGREIRKRYFRADGSQYGEEDVLWNADGTQLGWDFRYLGKEGGASFRYSYQAFDAESEWILRIRSRDGVPERLEICTRTTGDTRTELLTPVVFAPGRVTTDRSETSPSFSADARTMVFARYGDDWTRKEPFIAYLEEDGWRVEPIAGIGSVYNLAISPDANTIFFATREGEKRTLFRIHREGRGWSSPENLTKKYNLTGTYPCLAENGDLVYYDAEGDVGAGIYKAPGEGVGFGAAVPVYVPTLGPPFDAYTADLHTLLVTRCFDDVCETGPENGIWQVRLDASADGQTRKLANLPYAWGVQPVESLGLCVFTDGEDILAIPLVRTFVD